MKKSRFVVLVSTAALVVAGCGGDDDSDAGTQDAAPADLRLSSTDLGDILVDADGNTVYLFTPDEQGDSACYGACESTWPIVGELSTAGDGIDIALVGTIERTTGDTQATYNDWPLYYFSGDAAAGDVNGQGVNSVWYVVDGEGHAVVGG